MSISRRRPRLPRLAGSTGAIALIGALALSATLGGVEETDAAWTDTEESRASLTASWADGGWAKTTSNAYSNFASYSSWGSTVRSIPREERRDSTPTPGAQTDTRGDLTSSPLTSNFSVDTPHPRPGTGVTFCVQAAAPLATAGSQSGCTSAGPTYTLSSQTRAKSWGTAGGMADPVAGGGEPLVWVEANNVRTMAECAADGSSYALPPTATLGNTSGVGFIATFSKTISGILTAGYTDSWYKTLTPTTNTRVSAWVLPNYASGTSYRAGSVYIRVSLTSRAYATSGYAISDLYVTIDQYRQSNKSYLGSFSMVLSRSECAVTTPIRPREPLATVFEPLPATAPAYPADPATTEIATETAPIPNGQGIQSASELRSSLGGAPGEGGGRLAPMTTLTSPAEVTASETTTSAPPDPAGDESATPGTSTAETTTTVRRSTNPAPTATTAPTSAAGPPATQATTSTSAASATAGPDAPGPLSPTARMEDVGIVEVGGEALVVVTGTTVPPDAPQGARALDRWLTDGVEPSGDWTGFASGNPAHDGWRWAAVNRSTGTVLYMR